MGFRMRKSINLGGGLRLILASPESVTAGAYPVTV